MGKRVASQTKRFKVYPYECNHQVSRRRTKISRTIQGRRGCQGVVDLEDKNMPLTLNFHWEEAPGSKTLSNPGSPRSADHFTDAPARLTARQSAFYRNLVRLAEQTETRMLPISFLTLDGLEKRMDYGCMKIAEHAGFIEPIANSSKGVVETLMLKWNPSI
jgi:hypothetical protein